MKKLHVIGSLVALVLSACAQVDFNVASSAGVCGAEFTRAVQRGASLGAPVRGAIIPNEYIVAVKNAPRRGGIAVSAVSVMNQIASLDDVAVREVSEGLMPRMLVEMTSDRAESLSFDSNLIVEPNRVVTVLSNPELIVSDFKANTTSTLVGGVVTFQITIKNTGSLASGTFGVVVEIEDNAGLAKSVCKAVEVGAAGEVATGIDVTMPTVAGSYRARVKVDSTNLVLESDETNNAAGPLALSVQTTLAPSADLVVTTDLGGINATVGAAFGLQVRVTNQGAASSVPTKVSLFRNAAAEPAANVAADASVDVGALAVGASVVLPATLTFAAAGTSAVRAIVDRENVVVESNEANNSSSVTALAVTLQNVPTGIRRMNAHKSSAKAGDGAGVIDNVTVAIVDTGIDLEYTDELNVVGNQSFVGGTGDDGNGHGTHVAGTVGAKDNGVGVVGVVPGVKLFAVRVLGNEGSGTNAGVISGIEYACSQATGAKVINMSLGGGFSQLVNTAVQNCVAAGVTVVVAAGNENQNSANVSPASEPLAITVGALADSNGLAGGGGAATSSGADDTFATFSNFGNGVDVMAPGVQILSTRNGGGTVAFSGTSMASPHIAGLAALYLSKNLTATPAQVAAAIVNAAATALKRGGAGRDYPIADASAF